MPRMAPGKKPLKALALLTAGWLGSMNAAALTLDPASCPSPDPEGKAYIAVGTAVLRLPVRELVISDDPPAWVTFPRPPQPEEPRGCKGNPLPQLTLIQAFQFEAWQAKTSRRSPLTQLRLIGALPAYYGLRLDQAHTQSCRLLPGRIRLGNGLEGCIPLRKPSDRHVAGSGSYQAPHSVYPLPMGQLFTASCIPSAGGLKVKCTVSYRLEENLAVSYEFDTDDLPLENLMDFDRQLSADIMAAIVHEYPWPQRTEQ